MLFIIFAHNPATAMYLSLFIPGGGQVYNKQYIKAGIISIGEGTLAYLAYSEHTKISEVTIPEDSLKELHIEKRNSYLFFLTGLIFYSMADAYTDAHFFKYKERLKLGFHIDLQDKALKTSLKIKF